jgi:Porin subfamily
MRKVALGVALLVVIGGFCAPAAAAVEYVKVCSLYGAGFFYVPGTDTCINPVTGDMRTQTEFGTRRFVSDIANRVAVTESEIAALQDAQQALRARFDAAFRDQADGIAIAMALESPDLAGSEHFGFKVNWGTYENSNAFGVTFAGVLAENANNRLTLSGGVAFTGNNIGGHAGLQFSW